MIERMVSLLYVVTFGLMVTVLWTMAESRSMESQTHYYLPLPADLVKAASEAGGK